MRVVSRGTVRRALLGALAGGLCLAPASCSWARSGRLDDVQAELSRQRRQWRAQRMDGYEYILRRLCFCPPPFNEAVRVRVRDGQVVDRTLVEEGDPIAAEYARHWPAVEGLFEVVQDAIDRDAHSISVEYHPQLGYPTAIQIDYEAMMADEELGFTATGVTPLD